MSELSLLFRGLVGSLGSVVGLAREEAQQLFRIGFAVATVVRSALCMMRQLDGDDCDGDHEDIARRRCGVEAQLESAATLFDEFRVVVRQFAAALHAVCNVRH